MLRGIVNRHLRELGLAMAPTHFLDGYATGISLVASTKGVPLLPAYVKALLPASLVSRPLASFIFYTRRVNERLPVSWADAAFLR